MFVKSTVMNEMGEAETDLDSDPYIEIHYLERKGKRIIKSFGLCVNA
jgi:hypothetical protein